MASAELPRDVPTGRLNHPDGPIPAVIGITIRCRVLVSRQLCRSVAYRRVTKVRSGHECSTGHPLSRPHADDAPALVDEGESCGPHAGDERGVHVATRDWQV